MIKKSPTNKNTIQNNFFMSPLPNNPKPYYKNPVDIDLTTIIKNKGKDRIQKCYPVFNDDGLFYTPTFLLDNERDVYQFLDQMMKNQYNEKLKNSEEKSTNVMTMREEI